MIFGLFQDGERKKMREQIAAARQGASENPAFELVLDAPPPRAKPPQQKNQNAFEVVLTPEQQGLDEQSISHVNASQPPAADVVLAGSLWTAEAGADVENCAVGEFEVRVEGDAMQEDERDNESAMNGPSDDADEVLNGALAMEEQLGIGRPGSAADGQQDGMAQNDQEWTAEDDDYVELVETMRDVLVDIDDVGGALDDGEIEGDQIGAAPAREGNVQNLGRLVHGGQTLKLPNVSEDDSLCYQVPSYDSLEILY